MYNTHTQIPLFLDMMAAASAEGRTGYCAAGWQSTYLCVVHHTPSPPPPPPPPLRPVLLIKYFYNMPHNKCAMVEIASLSLHFTAYISMRCRCYFVVVVADDDGGSAAAADDDGGLFNWI